MFEQVQPPIKTGLEKAKEAEDIFAEAEKPVAAPPAPAVEAPVTVMPEEAWTAPSRKRWVIAVIIVVVLLLVGGGIWIWGMRPAGEEEIPLPPAPEVPAPAETPAPATPAPATVPPETTAPAVDTDLDGLADVDEQILGTNPQKMDTDEDGLLDGEEVNAYKTDPLKADADGDGYKDGEEVRAGYDPKNPAKGAKLFMLPRE